MLIFFISFGENPQIPQILTKLEQLIFAGAKLKKPLGFDNTRHVVNPEYGDWISWQHFVLS